MPKLIKTLGELNILELNGDGNTDDVDVVIALLKEYMPQYAHYEGRIREIVKHPYDANPEHYHHVWMAQKGDQRVGMLVFEYLPHRDCGLAMDMAILPEHRRGDFGQYQRLSEALLLSAVAQLGDDSKVAKRPLPVGLGGEIDYENLLEQYKKYTFIVCPARYYEPPDISGEHLAPKTEAELLEYGFNPMTLGMWPHQAGFNSIPALDAWEKVVKAFLVEHYHLPEDHVAVQVAIESMRERLNSDTITDT